MREFVEPVAFFHGRENGCGRHWRNNLTTHSWEGIRARCLWIQAWWSTVVWECIAWEPIHTTQTQWKANRLDQVIRWQDSVRIVTVHMRANGCRHAPGHCTKFGGNRLDDTSPRENNRIMPEPPGPGSAELRCQPFHLCTVWATHEWFQKESQKFNRSFCPSVRGACECVCYLLRRYVHVIFDLCLPWVPDSELLLCSLRRFICTVWLTSLLYNTYRPLYYTA